jgi:hypothetical protein
MFKYFIISQNAKRKEKKGKQAEWEEEEETYRSLTRG